MSRSPVSLSVRMNTYTTKSNIAAYNLLSTLVRHTVRLTKERSHYVPRSTHNSKYVINWNHRSAPQNKPLMEHGSAIPDSLFNRTLIARRGRHLDVDRARSNRILSSNMPNPLKTPTDFSLCLLNVFVVSVPIVHRRVRVARKLS